MLKLEDVRLIPYGSVDQVPAGWKLVVAVSRGKKPKAPIVSPWNWYSRFQSFAHELFAKLVETEAGLTIDEVRAVAVGDPENEAKSVEVLKVFQAGQARPMGWDLITDEATGTRFRIIYRDPRVHYVKEQGMEGDFSGAKIYEPLYLDKVRAMIEEIRNPKPPVEPKPRVKKADVTKGEVGSTGKTELRPSVDPKPEGGYLKAVLDAGLMPKLEDAVVKLVEADTADAVKAFLDANGLEGNLVIEAIAGWQRDNKIKSGFYRLIKEVAAELAAKKVVPVVPVAAPVA